MERATTGLGLVHNIMGIFSPRLKRSDCSQSPPPMNPNNESINITTIDNEIVHKLDDTLLTHSPPSSSSPVTEIDIPFCSIPLRLSSRFSNRRSLAAAREHRRSLKAPIAPQELVEKFVGLQDLKSSAFRRSKKFGEDCSKRTSEVWTVENKGRNTPDDDMDLLSLQPSSTSQDETVNVPPTTQPVPTETNDIPEVVPEPIRSDSINTRLMNETAPELWLLEPSEATSRWGPDAIKSRISVINTEGRPSEFWLLGPAAAPATRSDSVNVPVITNMSPPSKLTNKIENLPTTKLAEPIATQSKKRKDSPSEMLPPPKTRRLDKYLLPTENIKVTPDASVMTTQPVPIVKEAPIQRKNSRNNKPAASAPTKPKNIPKVYPLSVPKAERPKVLVRKTVPTLPLPRYKCPKEPVPSRPLIKTKRRAATDPQVKITRQPSIKKENIKSNDQVTLKRMLERTLMENAALKEEVELLKLENSKLKSDLSTKSAI